MKTKQTIAIAIIALLGASAFFSCDGPISLGKKLNLEPPVVTIEKPDFMENVGGLLEVTGTASDMEEIIQISVTVARVSKGGASWEQEWNADRGAWKSRSAEASWELRDDAVWIEQTGKGDIRWGINVDLSGAPNGEYAITAGAVNNVQNAGSLVERRVVIDTEPPVVFIITPELEFADTEDTTYTYGNDVEPAFAGYKLKDPFYMNRLFNQRIRVQYEIKDSFSINTLMFQLADNVGNIYYNKESTLVQSPGWNGAMTIPASEIVDELGVEITSRLDVQLISRVTDRAGNERVYSHGWLVYDPDSDKPWTMDVGHEGNPQLFAVYPHTDVQGRAYDDDGVKEVSWRIFSNSPPFDPAPGYEDGPKTLVNTPMAEGATPSTFFPWSFTAPEACDEYSIVINCKDVNGLAGDEEIRYFYVLDTSASSVEVHTPDRNETLFGDASGAFSITGRAGDGVNPTKLAIVWISPKADPESQIQYQSSDSPLWAAATSTGHTDTYGNKLWDIVSPAFGTPYWDEILKRMYRDFTKPLNLFTDLNIGTGTGQNYLTAQNFILRVEGDNQKATTVTHSVQGDITPPELTIATITVKRGSETTTYTTTELADPNKSMNALNEGDQISLTGTWGDDSFDHWNNLSRMGAFTVTWNNDPVPSAALTTTGTPKGWTAGPLTLDAEQVLAGGGRIVAELRDLGNNVTTAAFSAKVDSNIPRLMFISSDKPDGAYSSGTVEIYLEFNKEVTVDATPNLTLTNNYTAVYAETSGYSGTRHRFTYTIGTGHNADPLGVTSIGPANAVWSGSGGKVALAIPAGQNLQNLKKIKIDTVAPTITSVQSMTGETGAGGNYYTTGRTIYLLVNFSEAINFTAGAPATAATLTLNSNVTASGTATGTVSAINPQLSGASALLFTYTVAAGQNTPFTPPTNYGASLNVASFNIGTATIADLAGNALTAFTIPSGANISGGANPKTIYIDTTAPGAPTFGTTSSAAGTYDPATNPPHFTLDGEPGATFSYSTNNGTSWLPYTGEVTLRATGTHNVTARQKDRAGNENLSAIITPARQYIVKSSVPLLTSLSASTSGTYKAGETITVTFNLRDPVAVGGSESNFTLTFNNPTATTATATASGSTLVFNYTIPSGVNTPASQYLGIATLNRTGTATDLATELMDEWSTLNWGTAAGKRLSDVSQIVIDTTIPALQGTPTLSANGETLTLNFNKEIYKGNGNIRLVQQGTYLAPAVLTETEFQRYGGASVLGSYYTVGTNGTTSAGVADTAKKYILNYTVETNNANLTNALITRGAHSVTVPVTSGAVVIANDRRSLTVTLTSASGFALQVKGVNYGLYFDAALVQDSLNTPIAVHGNFGTLTNPGTPGTTLAYAGTNPPFIRVQKESASKSMQTVQEQRPVYSWALNSTISTSAQNGYSQVDPCDVLIQNGAQIYTQAGTNRLQQSAFQQVQGYVFRNDTTGAALVKWDQNQENGYTNVTSNFYINPYEHRIVLRDGEPPYSTAGAAIISTNNNKANLWVNLSTGTVANTPTAPGNNYFGVSDGTTQTVTINKLVATQPRNATVKIDCQTPNATLNYGVTNSSSAQYSTPFPRTNGIPTPSMPNATDTTYTRGSPFTLLTTNDANDIRGYLCGIRATATPQGGGTAVPAYEVAARSVIQFNGFNGNIGGFNALRNLATGMNKELQLWLRGGDSPSGDNTTPGFPLSWNEKDHTPGPSSAQLMTKVSDADNWYWITWGVTVPAYSHFVAGTTNGDSAQAERGPHDWVYSKNAWSYMKEGYLLHPGESLQFSRGNDNDPNTPTFVTGQPRGTYEFFGAFTSTRY